MTADPLMVQTGFSDLVVDAAGPDPIVVQRADGLHVDVPDEPLTIQFAAVGMPGRDGVVAPIEGVAAAAMIAGMPVAVDRTSGQLLPADAAYKPTAFVVGLLAADVDQGFIALAETDRLDLADWTPIAGTQQLVPGVTYFLADGGGLTVIPPVSSCVAIVGRAIGPTALLIGPQVPIEL